MKKILSSKYFFIPLLSILFIFSGFISAYYISENQKKESVEKNKNDTKEALKALTELVEKESKEKNKTPIKSLKLSSEIDDYKSALKYSKQVENSKSKINPNKKIVLYSNRPKLVIILDDVSFKYQVKEIKKIPFYVTPSFFPPTKTHPNTPLYAKEFKSYMVHLPLEALHFHKEEENTLHNGDSYLKIDKRIAKIKEWFPDDKFINNHTGSKFTSSYRDMKKLFNALNHHNINFVDSRTTPISQAPKIAKIYHKTLFSRNIFLDNIQDEKIIKKQLLKAVKIAKKNGFAIAIGHPHKATIKALMSSKTILKDVDIISIDELNELNKNNKLSKL